MTLPYPVSPLLAPRKSLVAQADYDLSPRKQYEIRRWYYENNGLYDRLWELMVSVGAETQSMRPLRNPAFRIVEFYAAKLWPGQLPDALPIVSKKANPAFVAAIQQVWKWSGWSTQKQVAVRWFAMYGDWFTKVVVNKDKLGTPRSVYYQLIDAQHMTDFTLDERGYLTYARIDIPQERGEGADRESYTYTEVWDKDAGTMRTWEHKQQPETPLLRLGTPKEQVEIRSWGIDFIPIVQAKFRDTGNKRGVCSFNPTIDKIDEANRAATRLHQMLWRHNKALWALQANAMDAQGRPVPAPLVTKNSDGKIDLSGDGEWIPLPGMSSLTPLVPQINYSAALAILQDHMAEIERDQPEMLYSRMAEFSAMSGIAIRYLLAGAIDRLLEARGNAEAALARLDAMALTLGQIAGLFGTDIGSYATGDFEHTFGERDVMPPNQLELAQTMQALTTAGMPLASALRWTGTAEDKITEIMADKTAVDAAQQNIGSSLLTSFNNTGV
jgi:hypothetical protein